MPADNKSNPPVRAAIVHVMVDESCAGRLRLSGRLQGIFRLFLPRRAEYARSFRRLPPACGGAR